VDGRDKPGHDEEGGSTEFTAFSSHGFVLPFCRSAKGPGPPAFAALGGAAIALKLLLLSQLGSFCSSAVLQNATFALRRRGRHAPRGSAGAP
jgi:hypothetical protein